MSPRFLLLKWKRVKESKIRQQKLAIFDLIKTGLVVLIIFIVTGIIGFSLFSAIVVAQYQPYLSDHNKMLSYKNDTLTFYDRTGQVIYRTPGRYNTELVPLKNISPYLVKATVAVEDRNFYDHDGISLRSTARALFSDVKRQDLYHQGGSTITQQLARTFFLSQEKSFTRKAKELILSFELERRYSKDEILEFYFNSVYYGAGAYGAPEAAKVYFGKNVKDLTLSESSLLAALPVSPTNLSPIDGDRTKAFQRQKFILNLLKEKGTYSEKDVNLALSENLKINEKLAATTNAPHFAIYLKNQLAKEFPNIDLDTSGFRVYTTLDLAAQHRAERLVTERVRALRGRNVTNGAFFASNPQTGEILAMVGSVDFSQAEWGSVNILTSKRSPGSAIKPIVYASALESGRLTPSTVLHDQPTSYKNQWESYSPTNSDNKYHGDVLPRIALSNSLNVPAVQVINLNGLNRTLDTAKKLGIDDLSSPSNYGLSFALGGLELEGIDLATSYAVFANGGYLIKPWGILKVENKFNEQIYKSNPQKQKVLDERIAYQITNILSDLEARRMLFGRSNPLEIGRTAAAKTGTGQDFKNAWTVGYTPNLLALVWVGNNNGSSMRDIWGLESAALIWNRFMKETLAKSPNQEFAVPAGIQIASICKIDGSLAVQGESSVKEVFVEGTQPTKPGACSFLAKKKKEEEEERKRREEEEPQIPIDFGGFGTPILPPGQERKQNTRD